MDITQVKSPKHYTEGRKFEPKDVIRDWGLNFNLGSALKYIARAGRKDDIVQDLRKAQEYIDFEIQAIEAERKAQQKPFVKPECKEVDPFKILLDTISDLTGAEMNMMKFMIKVQDDLSKEDLSKEEFTDKIKKMLRAE